MKPQGVTARSVAWVNTSRILLDWFDDQSNTYSDRNNWDVSRVQNSLLINLRFFLLQSSASALNGGTTVKVNNDLKEHKEPTCSTSF